MLLDDVVRDTCKTTLPTRVLHVALHDSIAKDDPEKEKGQERSPTIIELGDQIKNELFYLKICDKIVFIFFHLFTDYKVLLVYSSFYILAM